MTEQVSHDHSSSLQGIIRTFTFDENKSSSVSIKMDQQRILTDNNGHPDSECTSSTAENSERTSSEDSSTSRTRTLSSSIFSLEISAVLLVFIICMVLASAFREDQTNLRSVMQIIYAYIYLICIIWMSWYIYDISRFRRNWLKFISTLDGEIDYESIVEKYPHRISYFHATHNTGGLFLKVGAGILCMGSLLLTAIELARIIEILRIDSNGDECKTNSYSRTVSITKAITFSFRFVFHCVQFTFLFSYGNIVIDRYHLLAKIGLIHLIIANFCTWFETIVIETLEELHRHSEDKTTTTISFAVNTTKTSLSYLSTEPIHLLKASSSSSANETSDVLQVIESIHLTLGVYLYPCLIEYSLISVTFFYIIWRNIGKKDNCTMKNFTDRHVFTVNCSRAFGGLLLGGIIFLLTIASFIPVYILDSPISILMTKITQFILLIVSFLIVCISFSYTTKLYYDHQARVDIFDQILILVTTVGDFAYSFFSLFASIFIPNSTNETTRILEILVGIFALFETIIQSAFILDTFKRRILTKKEMRIKPGRELITALLFINLAIWLHDSFSAKKVKLSLSQNEFYSGKTWSIVHAFTSPLSIFYRFHSSVCLADIWQEVYHDHRHIH